jgi:hypothetical protein
MAHQPVGNGTSFAITSSNAQSSAISHQSDTLRVVAVGAPAHVAIGTDPTATNANYYVASGQEATISLGRPSSQRVVGITTGATTTIDFPEGTGSPFEVGDAVSLTVTGQSYYDFSHKTVKSVDTSSNVGGYFNTRIVINHDSSGVATAFSTPYAELRGSFKVGSIAATGSGTLYAQQVQVSGVA